VISINRGVTNPEITYLQIDIGKIREGFELFFSQYSITNWFFVWIIMFLVIFYQKSRAMTWERRCNVAAVTLLILTIVLIPFHFWGTYSLSGILNGGLYEGSDSFSLSQEETYTSETLSNKYSEFNGLVMITSDGGYYTFYICDENNPEVRYSEANYTDSVGITLSLPYHHSGLFIVANWTLNFYNPGQNESISVVFETIPQPKQAIIDPPPPSPLYKYQQPMVALVNLWFAAGLVTLFASSDNKWKQGITILAKDDNLKVKMANLMKNSMTDRNTKVYEAEDAPREYSTK
jgi:hypothetical protein